MLHLVFLVALVCFVILAVTGFFPLLVLGKSIGGYWLMAHATAAPVFAACLAVLAVMWAHNCRFSMNDCPRLQKLLGQPNTTEPSAPKYQLGQKVAFWLIIVLALPVILSAVLSMFPLFGTHCQKLLLNTHRYSTLLFALVAIVHIYLLIRIRMNKG